MSEPWKGTERHGNYAKLTCETADGKTHFVAETNQIDARKGAPKPAETITHIEGTMVNGQLLTGSLTHTGSEPTSYTVNDGKVTQKPPTPPGADPAVVDHAIKTTIATAGNACGPAITAIPRPIKLGP